MYTQFLQKSLTLNRSVAATVAARLIEHPINMGRLMFRWKRPPKLVEFRSF